MKVKVFKRSCTGFYCQRYNYNDDTDILIFASNAEIRITELPVVPDDFAPEQIVHYTKQNSDCLSSSVVSNWYTAVKKAKLLYPELKVKLLTAE